MPNKIFVRPVQKGLIVLKPNGIRLTEEGESVDADIYWQRRLNDQEVEIKSTPNNKGK